MKNIRLLLPLFLFCCTFRLSAQDSRLTLLPNEVRIKNARLIVERETLIVVADANYSVPDSGKVFVLPEVTAARTFMLPPANSCPLREIIVLDKTSGTNRWTVTGGLVDRTQNGTPPFNTQNNVVLGKNTMLVLFSDGEKWWNVL